MLIVLVQRPIEEMLNELDHLILREFQGEQLVMDVIEVVRRHLKEAVVLREELLVRLGCRWLSGCDRGLSRWCVMVMVMRIFRLDQRGEIVHVLRQGMIERNLG